MVNKKAGKLLIERKQIYYKSCLFYLRTSLKLSQAKTVELLLSDPSGTQLPETTLTRSSPRHPNVGVGYASMGAPSLRYG